MDKIEQGLYQQLQDQIERHEKKKHEQLKMLLRLQKSEQKEQEEEHHARQMELRRKIIWLAKRSITFAVNP